MRALASRFVACGFTSARQEASFTFSVWTLPTEWSKQNPYGSSCPSNSMEQEQQGEAWTLHLYLLIGCALKETPASLSGMCVCFPSRHSAGCDIEKSK